MKNTSSADYTMKNKRILSMCRAPQAPKRFRSSFILFYLCIKAKIKAELGEKASGPDISKRASAMWKALSTKDRQHWEDKATKEREQYEVEKAAYTGPWRVPHKRAKKDPTAPRRNPSAFLLFAQDERKKLRKLNPGMKITEISRILGQLWRDLPKERKIPYIEREVKERNKYKSDTAEWRRKQDTILLTGKGTDSNSVSIDKGNVGGNVQQGRLKDSVAAGVHDRFDNKVYYRSPFASANRPNYDTRSNVPQTIGYGSYHPHQRAYSQQYTINRKDGYESRCDERLQEDYRYVSPYQRRDNGAIDRDFKFASFPITYEPSYQESRWSPQIGWREDRIFSHSTRSLTQSNKVKIDGMTQGKHDDEIQPCRPLEHEIRQDVFDVLFEHFDQRKSHHIKHQAQKGNSSLSNYTNNNEQHHQYPDNNFDQQPVEDHHTPYSVSSKDIRDIQQQHIISSSGERCWNPF